MPVSAVRMSCAYATSQASVARADAGVGRRCRVRRCAGREADFLLDVERAILAPPGSACHGGQSNKITVPAVFGERDLFPKAGHNIRDRVLASKPDHAPDIRRRLAGGAQFAQARRLGGFRKLAPADIEDELVVMPVGTGRSSSACNRRWICVAANRSRARVTKVTPWIASSTVTAR